MPTSRMTNLFAAKTFVPWLQANAERNANRYSSDIARDATIELGSIITPESVRLFMREYGLPFKAPAVRAERKLSERERLDARVADLQADVRQLKAIVAGLRADVRQLKDMPCADTAPPEDDNGNRAEENLRENIATPANQDAWFRLGERDRAERKQR